MTQAMLQPQRDGLLSPRARIPLQDSDSEAAAENKCYHIDLLVTLGLGGGCP